MKITTKMGDKGETSLFGGRRVSKASRIIEVIGGLDELQAVVGWCGAGIKNRESLISGRLRAEAGTDGSVVTSRRLQIGFINLLKVIEDDLYRIMSIVGFEFKCPKNIKAIGEADVKRLEKEIEKYEILIEKSGGLKKFVRPDKSELSARLHIARTVCRRVERRMAGMVEGLECEMKSIPGNGSSHSDKKSLSVCQQASVIFILKYLNRLSDLLFVMACVG